MKAPLHKKLTRYLALQKLLHTTRATSHLGVLPAIVTTLNALLAEAQALHAIQLEPTLGITQHRNQALHAALDATLDLSALLQSYAASHCLHDLAARGRLTPTLFLRTRTILRPLLLQRIVDAATPLAATLADYGLTPGMLADAQQKIAVAEQMIRSPRRRLDQRHIATQRLEEVFREIETLFTDRLDPLFFPLRKTHSDFYLAYRVHRVNRVRFRRDCRTCSIEQEQPTAPADVTSLATLRAA